MEKDIDTASLQDFSKSFCTWIEQYTLFFYKEPTSRPSSKSSLFIDLNSANCSTKSSLIVP